MVEIPTDGPAPLELLAATNPEIVLSAWSTPRLESLLEKPGCRIAYVCHLTGSVRNVVPRSFIERGGKVTNWGTFVSTTVAEHGLLLALAALRNLPGWSAVIAGPRTSQAARVLGTRTLVGRRVGIHGFGGVAQALVTLLRPFNVSVVAWSAGVPSGVFREHGVGQADSLDDLFSRSEVLFECEALTPQTRGIVSAQTLARLPDGAIFVNIARGELVDESALRQEASSGRLRLALDVVASEPLTTSSPMFGLGGTVLSPHIGGPTYDLWHPIGAYAAANLERFVAGQPLLSPVTLEVFDRST